MKEDGERVERGKEKVAYRRRILFLLLLCYIYFMTRIIIVT